MSDRMTDVDDLTEYQLHLDSNAKMAASLRKQGASYSQIGSAIGVGSMLVPGLLAWAQVKGWGDK